MQDLRDHRREQVIGRAFLVALETVDFVGVVGGDENDGHAGRTGMRMNRLGRLEAVHAGHADVQQDHGEIMPQHLPQRFLARAGDDQFVYMLIDRVQQQAFQRIQAGGVVVDE